MICGINSDNTPKYKPDDWTGTVFTTVIKTMFEHGYFREINQCEQGI